MSDEKSASMEGEISYTEIANPLKNMKNNKSPGLDVFTVGFSRVFWLISGHLFYDQLIIAIGMVL